MNAGSCYETLGVAHDATPDEITLAYQRRLGSLRAKLDGANPPAAEHLDALRAAYRTLSDPVSRRAHDAALAPPRAVDPPAGGDSAGETCSFSFTGGGDAYFRIWIVNLFLSLVTLGIYSAWAKVRRETFFHGNLVLDGSTFGYHGKAIAILKGRLVAVALLIALSAAQSAGPIAYAIAMLLLLPVVPWLVVRAFRFRAHNTSYRGLRFSFHGNYRQALTTFLGYGLLSAVSFGILFPLFYHRQKKFVLDNLRYGNSQFQCAATAGQFYRIFLQPVGLAVGVMFGVGILTAMGGLAAAVLPVIFVAGIIALMLFLMPYIRVRTTNLIWNQVTLERISFSSSMEVLPYFRLIAGNLMLMLLTMGLFWPWAQVRLAVYRANCMALQLPGSLDGFIAGETANAPAVGDEISELMDMDIAL